MEQNAESASLGNLERFTNLQELDISGAYGQDWILQNDLPRKGVVQTLEDLLSLDKESNVEIVILQRPEMDKNGHPSLNLISCHGMK